MQTFFIDLDISKPNDVDLQQWLIHHRIELKALAANVGSRDQVCRLIGSKSSLENFIDSIYSFERPLEANVLKAKIKQS